MQAQLTRWVKWMLNLVKFKVMWVILTIAIGSARSSLLGTKYEFNLKGVSSDGGSLVDPKLTLRVTAEGRVIENGLDIDTSSTGTDDKIIFRPTRDRNILLWMLLM